MNYDNWITLNNSNKYNVRKDTDEIWFKYLFTFLGESRITLQQMIMND